MKKKLLVLAFFVLTAVVGVERSFGPVDAFLDDMAWGPNLFGNFQVWEYSGWPLDTDLRILNAIALAAISIGATANFSKHVDRVPKPRVSIKALVAATTVAGVVLGNLVSFRLNGIRPLTGSPAPINAFWIAYDLNEILQHIVVEPFALIFLFMAIIAALDGLGWLWSRLTR
ncbi:MAG: hypothetical protein QGG36_04830 [Pirellulaceae bacterium]|jgi:hypothetical protein|nr:hypothetical protein [Pirellulaceae bacterium]